MANLSAFDGNCRAQSDDGPWAQSSSLSTSAIRSWRRRRGGRRVPGRSERLRIGGSVGPRQRRVARHRSGPHRDRRREWWRQSHVGHGNAVAARGDIDLVAGLYAMCPYIALDRMANVPVRGRVRQYFEVLEWGRYSYGVAADARIHWRGRSSPAPTMLQDCRRPSSCQQGVIRCAMRHSVLPDAARRRCPCTLRHRHGHHARRRGDPECLPGDLRAAAATSSVTPADRSRLGFSRRAWRARQIFDRAARDVDQPSQAAFAVLLSAGAWVRPAAASPTSLHTARRDHRRSQPSAR